MANDLGYTPGAGALIKTDQDAGDTAHMQIVKLANSTPGSSTAIPATVANGVTVDVTRVQTVVPINDNGGSLTVDGAVVVSSVNTPVTVVDGGVALKVQAPNPLPVSGTVTAIQGTAAALAGAWPATITDGVNAVGISTVGGAKALKVDVVQAVSTGVQTDKSAFVEGTGQAAIAGGVFNDTIGGDPAEDQAAALRITAKRGLHVNLRSVAGVEIGTSANPIRVDPTNATVQSGNVTQFAGAAVVAAAAGVPTVGIVNSAGAPFTQAIPLPTQNAPSGASGQTPWRSHVVLSASQTAQVIHTPAGGKTSYIESIQVMLSGGGGLVEIYDNANSATTRLWAAAVTWAFITQIVAFARPVALAAANNVLRYDTGASVVGDVVVIGYDA